MENQDLFGEDIHPDREQLILAMFLMMEHLKGGKSFWKPYIDVMNEADLVSYWDQDEIEQF